MFTWFRIILILCNLQETDCTMRENLLKMHFNSIEQCQTVLCNEVSIIARHADYLHPLIQICQKVPL